MKKVVAILLLIYLGSQLYGQNYNAIIDSLHQELAAHSAEDELKVDLLNALSYAYRRNAPDSIAFFGTAALELADKIAYKKGVVIANKNLGIANFKLGGNTEKSLNYYKACQELAQEIGDHYNQAACHNNIGLIHRSNLQYSKAIKSFQNALEVHEAHFPVDRLRMLMLGNIGKTYASMEDYKNAQLYIKEAIELANRYNNQGFSLCMLKIMPWFSISKAK